MARIAIGGWQHETNTFATIKADYGAFERADEWPPMSAGDELLDSVRNVHLPIAGAIEAIEATTHEIVPLLWCSATPCSYVTEHAFEKISAEMISMLASAMPVDGIYLDLHGAMVCEHLTDGEGEYLSRVRALVGKDLPIFVSLDLHANVTPLMVASATMLDIYRTYPHIDMAQTGYRVARLLSDHLRNPRQIYKSFQQIDFLIPLNTGCTLIEPCKSIYTELPQRISDSVPSLSFACGFHLSDIYDVGPAVVSYGYSQAEANHAVNGLADLVNQKESAFHEKIWPASEGIKEAKRAFEQLGKTIVIADTQDNPGGGGAGDTIGVLRAMIDHQLDNALIGVINDAQVAAMAHDVGIGGIFSTNIGGKVGIKGQASLHIEIAVKNLSDGCFTATGPMYRGAHMELGLTALLEIADILVVICSKAVQTADQAHFQHLGVDPSNMDFVAVKSSVHFRNDYESLASRIIIVSSPGEVYADPDSLKYKNIRPEMKITSMG